MEYKTPLETRLAKKTTKAIIDFDLIEDGDRVMVGLSGGKDSWALIQILDVLRRRAPIKFSIVAVNVDSGYEGYQYQQLTDACVARGWEFHHERTSIGAVIDDKLDADATPCSLCARLRRGVLYRWATKVGATKIALGHHLDDFVETLLLNLFLAGALKAMPARLVSDNKAHVVIRPLVYVTEAEARGYARENDLPIIESRCFSSIHTGAKASCFRNGRIRWRIRGLSRASVENWVRHVRRHTCRKPTLGYACRMARCLSPTGRVRQVQDRRRYLDR